MPERLFVQFVAVLHAVEGLTALFKMGLLIPTQS
jgi:hypothetical protein